MIFAETDGEPHNTITPIARMRNGKYELDLVLRNNLTTKEHPMGLYHPHEELHHIKKENIGLIEVMGLAILPARLKDQGAQIAEILAAELKQKPLTELRPVSKPRMTNVQRMQLVMKTIEEEIRPQLAADGGDIELVDVDGKRVVVSLRGRCAQCRSSEVTIRNLVERVLREHVEADIVVEEA